jgi:anthranilate phosphoribosyltransferase
MNVTALLKKLIARKDLTEDEAFEAIHGMLSGEFTEGQIGPSSARCPQGRDHRRDRRRARAMRAAATRLQSLAPDTLDTVGTGGDGGMTFNVSTTVAFVAAGAGAVVAKHGTAPVPARAAARTASNASASTCLPRPNSWSRRSTKIGIAFMFAPVVPQGHALRRTRSQADGRAHAVQPPRSPDQSRRRPLPAPRVFAPELTETFAEVLKKLGSRRVLVVHGHDGMDEITLTTTCAARNSRTAASRPTTSIRPSISRTTCTNEDLDGGAPADNAAITRGILEGKFTGPSATSCCSIPRFPPVRQPLRGPGRGHPDVRRRHRLRRRARQTGETGGILEDLRNSPYPDSGVRIQNGIVRTNARIGWSDRFSKSTILNPEF